MQVIETRRIAKKYGITQVLKDIEITVESGEWVALMGPSGCGKSTLLNIIGGLDEADTGTVQVASTNIAQLNASQRAVFRRTHVGIVFQAFNLIPHLTVSGNIEVPLRLNGTSRRAADHRAHELLKHLQMESFANASPTTLSGGQQQRVAIARALANRPLVLLADEPTGSLDTTASADVIELLRAEHLRGQTIVMVTHDERVAAAADRIVWMLDGVLTNRPSELATR